MNVTEAEGRNQRQHGGEEEEPEDCAGRVMLAWDVICELAASVPR